MWRQWATLKLMRKLLHQYSFVPNKQFTDELIAERSTGGLFDMPASESDSRR